RARYLDLRLTLLREVARGDVTGEQPDDDDHHQEFEQGETTLGKPRHVRQAFLSSRTLPDLAGRRGKKLEQSEISITYGSAEPGRCKLRLRIFSQASVPM